MRTLFEDTNVSAELEEAKGGSNKYLLLILWCVAIAFLAGTWSVFRWTTNRPAPPPPPPPVSLTDLKQVSTAFSQFNTLAREGKWTEAEAMLSTTARQQLTAENKTLRESLLGKLKDWKLTSAEPTPSVDSSDPNTFRQDFVFNFTDEGFTKVETKIIMLGLIIENGKLALNSWGDPKQPDKKGEKKADANKA
ncbi:MAG: hypothetical protein ABIP14_15060 [Blastocatellia bacterium]